MAASLLGVFLVGSFAMTPAVAAPEPGTSYGPYRFATGDGKVDGKFKVSSGGAVQVFINDWGTTDSLKVSLCSSSGSCTVKKLITDQTNVRWFKNMAGGTYYGNVEKVDNPGRNVKGYITFDVR